jgi:predicted transcriptional regulator
MSTKTTVYLEPESYRRLKALAARRGRSAADLVREAVLEYARRHAPAAGPRSLGAGRSGRRNLGTRAETLLKGFGERR